MYDRTASQWWDELSDDDRVALVYAVDSNRLSRAQWEKLAGAGIAAWEWRADRTDTAFYLPARFRRYVLDWANDAAA